MRSLEKKKKKFNSNHYKKKDEITSEDAVLQSVRIV